MLCMQRWCFKEARGEASIGSTLCCDSTSFYYGYTLLHHALPHSTMALPYSTMLEPWLSEVELWWREVELKIEQILVVHFDLINHDAHIYTHTLMLSLSHSIKMYCHCNQSSQVLQSESESSSSLSLSVSLISTAILRFRIDATSLPTSRFFSSPLRSTLRRFMPV